MSQWRRIALEQVPECKKDIEAASSPMAMWIELHCRLIQAYEAVPPEETTIQHIFGYARWCLWEPHRNADLFTAVAYAFVEHLPGHPAVRHDLPNHLSRNEFLACEGFFRYHLSDEQYEKFATEFLQAEAVLNKAWSGKPQRKKNK